MFDINLFKDQSIQTVNFLLNKINNGEFEKLESLQMDWDNYVNENFPSLNKLFQFLISSNSEEMYLIVPIKTAAANLERLIEVLTKDSINTSIKDISVSVPERYYDLIKSLELYSNLIANLKLTSKLN